MPHLSSLRLLVVGTYRDVELDVKRPFAKTLEALKVAVQKIDRTAAKKTLHKNTAARKKSQLTLMVNKKAEAPAAPPA